MVLSDGIAAAAAPGHLIEDIRIEIKALPIIGHLVSSVATRGQLKVGC